MATGWSASRAASRTASMIRLWVSCEPCDMLIRAMSMPAPTRARIISGVELAGPRVQIIFVLSMCS